MRPLDKTLRNKLEKTVKDARDIAETASRSALQQLGVGESKAFDFLSAEEKDLRRRLRAHGRQLGDKKRPDNIQELSRLTEEVAYEHWHRMLFAKFLAENNLLMYPDPDELVAVSLEECEELAADEGAKNGWDLAARYAAKMLPQIFRPDSPSFEILFPSEYEQQLEELLDDLEPEVFSATDSLGWVYQYWQAKRKDEVNASEVKIGARELPAVTQLFTEPYMVSFLLDNALGAWWAGKRLTETDFQTATSEDELRQKAAIEGVPLKYLRFVQDEDGLWSPASGTFEKWPESLAELKMLDPSSGSGHFLVSVLQMLVPLRMEMENLSAKHAIDAVLCDNLHGLEIDSRCVELAAFAVALAAWTFPGAVGYRPLPEMNIACSGLAVSVAKDEWKELALGKHNLRIALGWMYDTFKDAPVLGSLINPADSDASKIVEWDELSQLLTEALEQEEGEEKHEVGVIAQGLAKAAMMLGDKYHWVVTNVPYLVRGKQNSVLSTFCKNFYPDSMNDLATVFISRCLNFLSESGGKLCVVSPQNWLFQPRYKSFRERLLNSRSVDYVTRLGAGAFESISGEIVKVTLSILSSPKSHALARNIDISGAKNYSEKAEKLLTASITSVKNCDYLNSDGFRITSGLNLDFEPLHGFATTLHGQNAGDNSRFNRYLWEVKNKSDIWEFYQNAPKQGQVFSGQSQIIRWEKEKGEMYQFAASVRHLNHKAQQWRSGKGNWTRKGITLSLVGKICGGLYEGNIYGVLCAVIIPKNNEHRAALWTYAQSGEFEIDVRKFDSNLAIQAKTTLAVPFNLDHWQKVAEEKYPHGLPKPYTNDPTQWVFHGHPCVAVVWDEDTKWTASAPLRTDETVLQVAVARLLGYQWPAELDTEMELADEQRVVVEQCAELVPLADEDGIVCIPSVCGEEAAADRLLSLLIAAYGDNWDYSILDSLLTTVGHSGKSLESWLRDKFFAQHSKMFGHRPFIWHIWDGLNDGFSVLVNYHKLDYKLLETLIYTYLGDWITKQKKDKSEGVDGSSEKLDAAEILKKRLELILEGESPYDIFVRWKPLDKQPVGWNPDINDGVRLNIRPFLTVPDISKKKGTGILRDKPNIKWGKDRGKDVVSAPWYKLGLEYGGKEGDRINDHHLTLNDKKMDNE